MNNESEAPSTPNESLRFGGDTRVTTAMEDYLKVAYQIDQEGLPVTNLRLAERLGFSGPSVTNMMKKLDDLHLVVHNPYHGASLTPSGRRIALEVLRHHRLLELYLAEALGYSLDEVHDEAERLEHHVSEVFEHRMEQALGFPTFDPHGDPIPGRDGSLPVVDDVALLGIDPGQERKVSRVSDRDQEHLLQLTTAGIKPGATVTLVSNPLPDSEVALVVDGISTEIPWAVAQGVRVDTTAG